MPCRSDYMEPNAQEQESRIVAGHLLYILPIMDKPVPAGVKDAAGALYGNREKVDEWTALLCATCKELEADKSLANKYLWDGRAKRARELAAWWEEHQEFDRRRESEEHSENLKLEALSTICQALKKAGIPDATYDGDHKTASMSFTLDGKTITLSSRNVKVTDDE